MASVETAITTHIVRTRMFNQLLPTVSSLNPRVYIDKRKLGPWGNTKRALENVRPEATHLLILQDDIEVVRNFDLAVNLFADMFPDNLVSFYVPRRKTHMEAYEQGYQFVIYRNGLYGPAILFPTKYIADILEWQAKAIPQHIITNSDFRIGLYFAFKGIDMYNTVPSLVEHLGQGKSISHKSGELFGQHRAVIYLKDFDPMSVEWSPESVYPHNNKGSCKQWVQGNYSNTTPWLRKQLGLPEKQ